MNAVYAFREAFLQSDSTRNNKDEFSTWEGRKMRYAINWAMYENTAYRRAHAWADSYKTTYGLYRFIRGIYNPALRLGDFWQSHLWGGLLDAQAGDGKQKPSAIPISIDGDGNALRGAIAKVWDWSNWQSEKDVITLRGAVLGDSFIKIVDDPERKKAYMMPVHPNTIKALTVDHWGNVKAYTIEETRLHPRNNVEQVRYREEATREGDSVVYKTYMNDALYAWSDDGNAEWTVYYGFVPLVFIRHRHVGLPWGWAEMHAGLPNFREVDDQASLLNDQIRKMVNAPWLFAGVNAPATGNVQASTSTPTTDNPEAGREESPALYGPAGATATPLVAPLDITATATNIKDMLAKLERDFPELSDDLANAGGDVSGRALRINRQPIIDRVEQRRPNYDAALVRAQQMAVAIAGWRGYDDAFKGFDLDSYGAGKLDHSIGGRPVYAKDPLDDLEVEQALWTAASAAKTAGVPLSVFLKRNGWDDKAIKDLLANPEVMARADMLKASVDAAKTSATGDNAPILNRAQNRTQNGNTNGQPPTAGA